MKRGFHTLANGAGALALTAALAGCVVGPSYRAEPPAVPAAFSRAAEPQPAATAGWWRAFHDPMLDALVARALAGDLDVQRAGLRIEQARLQARIAAAADGPRLDAAAQANATRLSQNSSLAQIASQAAGPGGGLSSAGLPGMTVKTYQLGFDAGWELDLFGGVRRAKEAAGARVSQAVWSRRDAELMIAAETARGYLQYRAIQRRLALLDQRAALRAEALDFRRARQRNGLVATPELRQAEIELAGEAAARRALEADRDAQAHALAVLVGQPPLALMAELAAPAADPPAPDAVAVGLPSDLLRRRPDIRAAERALAAATADIGVATADLYPKINLTGAAGLVSGSLSSLLESDSFQPSAGAALRLPLLDGGRRKATVKLRRAQAEDAALAYRSVTLAALREVEDALTRLQADRDRERSLAVAETAARDALDTAQVRRRAGLTQELNVIEARAAALAAADDLIRARADRDRDLAALSKALGGGWTQADTDGETSQ